jgi:hypothetical protein
MLIDGVQPSTAAPQQLHEKNLPPPDPKYDGSTYWAQHAKSVQQWLVACNTPTSLWGVRGLVCLTGDASDYLHQQLLELELSYEQVVSNPLLLPWSKLDQIMSSGNFGSPPTDNSVRDKLVSFQQRKQSGQWNTPRHLSKMLGIIQQAINKPDDHTLIWFVQRSLHSQLQSKMQLTAANKPWESFADYCSSLRNVGAAMDRDLNRDLNQQQQQQAPPASKQQQQGYAAAAGKHAGAGGGGSGSKPGAAAPYCSGAPAAGGGGSGGKQQRSSGRVQHHARYCPSPRQQGFSPHVGKTCYNPAITPAEARRSRDAGLCFFCGTVSWTAAAKDHMRNCPKRKFTKEKKDVSG